MIRFSITIQAVKYYYLAFSAYAVDTTSWRPWIVDIEDPERRVSLDGQAQCSEYSVTIKDRDRLLRGEYEAGRTLKGCLTTLTTAYYSAYGWVTSVEELDNERVLLRLKDIYATKLEDNYPTLSLNKTTFVNMSDDNVGRSVIYPYGIMDSSTYENAHGAYDAICVDGRGLISGVEYNDYYCSELAIQSVDNVWREENSKWVKLAASQWSVLAGYAPRVIIRVIPQAFYASDTLSTATLLNDNHIHVSNVGRWRVGCQVTIAGGANLYTVTANDSVDKLSITPNILAAEVQSAGVAVDQKNDDTLKVQATAGDNHCHVNHIGAFPVGANIKLGDAGTTYTVTANDAIDKLDISPNVVSTVAIAQPVRWEGDNGAMPGLENIRVDVHGINGTANYGDPVITNPSSVRFHFLNTVVGISNTPPTVYFDAATWAQCAIDCAGKSIVMAGVVNDFKTGNEWDSLMGMSTMTETYMNLAGKLCIRLYQPTLASDYTFSLMRDARGFEQPEFTGDIFTKLIAKYAYNGSDYYAKTEFKAVYDIPKEISFDFQWDKTAAQAVCQLILKRYKAKPFLMQTSTTRAMSGYDIGSRLYIEGRRIITHLPSMTNGAIFSITAIKQSAYSGCMNLEGFDIRYIYTP